MIQPRIHLHVDYFENSTTPPLVGIITNVHHEKLVDLAVFHSNGVPCLTGKQRIVLLQDDDTMGDVSDFCKFPPDVLHAARTTAPVPGWTEAPGVTDEVLKKAGL